MFGRARLLSSPAWCLPGLGRFGGEEKDRRRPDAEAPTHGRREGRLDHVSVMFLRDELVGVADGARHVSELLTGRELAADVGVASRRVEIEAARKVCARALSHVPLVSGRLASW